MLNTTFVVGFSGQARSGKDTLVKILQNLSHYFSAVTQRVFFADPLKAMYVAAWQRKNTIGAEGQPYSAVKAWENRIKAYMRGYNDAFVGDALDWFNTGPDWSDTVLNTPYGEHESVKSVHRRNLIEVGMHFRQQDPDFWVKAAMTQVEPLTHFALISDVRFENEAAQCDFVVRVNRPHQSIIYKDGQIDPSEIFAVTGHYDHLVQNNAGIEQLVREGMGLFIELIVRREARLMVGSVAASEVTS